MIFCIFPGWVLRVFGQNGLEMVKCCARTGIYLSLVEALEYHTFKAMAAPVELHSVFEGVSSEHLNYKMHSMVSYCWKSVEIKILSQ